MTPLAAYLLARPELAAAPDDTVAAAYDADPAHWVPVPSHRVLAWMGEAGRLRKLKGFAAHPAADPQTVGLQSAVETVLLAAGNPSTVIDMAPASPHRQLLGVLVAAGVLTAADAAALVARGRPDGYAAPTAADVDAARAEVALYAAKSARLVALEAYASGVRAAVNAAESVDALPAVPEPPAVPGGEGA